MFKEMTLLTASYLGFCAGAALVALVFAVAWSIGHLRKARSEQLRAHSHNGPGPRPTQPSHPLIRGRIASDPVVQMAQSDSIVHVLDQYAYALQALDDYDHARLIIANTTPSTGKVISYHEAISQIALWRERACLGPLFGNEKDDSFAGSLNNIYASFDEKDLYPSAEEKAAHLLYFIVKNHSFSDGNKRIGAAMFAWFLHRNDCLYRTDGEKRLANNALVAITLLIAQSDPANRDMLITLVVNLINQSH